MLYCSCEIIITQWVTDTGQVLLQNDTSGLSTRNMSRNGEWDVTGTTTRTVMWSYTGENSSYDVHAVRMTLSMIRKARYIVTYIQIPCITTSSMYI